MGVLFMSKKSEKIITYSINITILVIFFVIAPLVLINWTTIKAFIAPSPYNKCMIQAHSKGEDAYCSDNGELRSHKIDKRNECQSKAPYYMWKVNGVLEECVRVKYESQSACVNDGVEGPIYDEGAPTGFRTRCLTDGTWKTYDSEPPTQITDCKDVTSYDYNWDNDMLCTRPDGSKYYTSYEGSQSAP